MRSIKKSERPVSNTSVFVAKFDGKKTLTLEKFYKKISKRLLFPDYFGHNLDALADCLSDLSWIDPSDVKLFIKNHDRFLEKETEETRSIIQEIFEDVMENPIEEDRSFEVVSVIDDEA